MSKIHSNAINYLPSLKVGKSRNNAGVYGGTGTNGMSNPTNMLVKSSEFGAS